MKKYENPSLEVKKFSIIDVISVSEAKTPDDGHIGNETVKPGEAPGLN